MRTKVLGYAVVAALGAGLWTETPAAAQSATDTGNKLWIEGGSTVRKWSCQLPAEQLKLEVSGGAADPAPGLPRGVQRVVVTVPVQAIECGNGKMNEHLRKALKAGEHPEIRYEMTSYAAGEAEAVRATGELTIAGATQPVEMPVALAALPAGGARVQGSYELRMTDWGVKPPTLMLGTLKVSPVVQVKFDVVVRTPNLVATNGSR
jgi:hypothetical protein